MKNVNLENYAKDLKTSMGIVIFTSLCRVLLRE